MSVFLMGQAWQANVGGAARKLVLIKLADNADDQGHCWPSYGHLALQCEMSKRTVMRYVDDLVLTGFVSKQHRKGGPNFNKSNLFKLSILDGDISNLKALKAAKKTGELLEEKVVDKNTPSDNLTPLEECHPCHPTGVNHVTPLVSPVSPRTIIEPSIEPSLKKYIKKPEFIPEIFELYPAHRRGGTDQQLAKVWKSEKLTDKDATNILNWLSAAAQSNPQWQTNASGQYVPGLTRFIRERLWLTPVPVAKTTQGNEPDFHSNSTDWAKDLGL